MIGRTVQELEPHSDWHIGQFSGHKKSLCHICCGDGWLRLNRISFPRPFAEKRYNWGV
jgi:hypothetical protein